jgi:3-hydroxyacyl-CoA dehydrogenase
MKEGANPVRLERDGDIGVIVIDNPPVNAGSIEVRRGLLAAIGEVRADPLLRAAIIIGAGNTFIAGADIKEFGKPLEDPQLPQVIAAICACEKPFVAAIHGAALGGGFELCLGCDGRVAAPDAVVGLPEVTLGMIPGAGGTQLVPRLIGIAAAIPMICSGKRIAAKEALAKGLIDQVIVGVALQEGAVAFAWRKGARKRRLGAERVPAEEPAAIEQAATQAMRAGKNRPQVLAAIEAIKSAATLSFPEALAKERAVFQTLRMSREAASLRYLFFAERAAARVEGLEGAVPAAIARAGIAGAGTMGAAIAMCFADAGISAVLTDKNPESLARGMDRIRSSYARQVSDGRISGEEAEKRVARIAPASRLEAFSSCDLVIEAVSEDMDVKRELFAALDRIMPAHAVLASNTSYLNLDAIAAATKRAQSVVGLHFFNPANVMRLVEVVRGGKTSAQTLATALALAKRLRKLAVVARVGEGFIGNRIYAAYRRQCEFMLEEGAYPEEIDAALEAFGFAMGPFAVTDSSGLDIAWAMRKRLAATRNPRERYVEIPDRLCEMGRLGRKTGAGWYRYPEGARKGEPDPIVRTLIEEASAARGIARRRFEATQIQTRVLVTMVNEAALLLEERIAARPSDIDLVLVNGYGFPNYEGGPLFWGKAREKSWLLAQVEHLRAVSGFGFRTGDAGALHDELQREA